VRPILLGQVDVNPILPSHYLIPDGEAHRFSDGRMYLYGSSDIRGSTAYCSHEYRVFSSNDLIDWTDGGVSFDSARSHAPAEAWLYAPDCMEYQGKYYLAYCTDGDREGIAVSDSPMGPFAAARPVQGADGDGIDPALFLDDDGQVYYFWGQYHLRGARLDMTNFSVVPASVQTHLLEEKKDGFHEGACIRKRGAWYYAIFADISRGRPTCLGYAMSRNPVGPYEKKGVIIDNIGCDPETWNNHGSIEQFQGKWYVFYHRACQGGRFTRRACIEPIAFNDDGTINEVEMTTQGCSPPIPATDVVEAWRACFFSGKLRTAVTDESDPKSGEHLTLIEDGAWAAFKYIDFGTGSISRFTVRAASAAEGGRIEVRLDHPDGPVIADCAVGKTGAWCNWKTFGAPVSGNPQGVHAVYLKFRGGLGRLFDLHDFEFEQRPGPRLNIYSFL
jgi:arabinoxylan arabinofuranohydrolase